MTERNRLHGGNFAYLAYYDSRHAARVYQRAAELFGPFATAAEFAAQCDWNTDDDAREFVERNQEWPPRAIADELRYM